MRGSGVRIAAAAVVMAAAGLTGPVRAGLEVTALGKLDPTLPARDEQKGSERKWRAVVRQLPIEERRVVVRQVAANTGGNTSVRNCEPLKWKIKGYYQRNRDLGQVFTAPRTFVLDAIVLRTGPGDSAFLEGTAGAPVFVQFFEVTGTPVIDDNGTPVGTKATHGFSTNHRCDDFVTGIAYEPVRVVKGGRMPDLAAAGDGRFVYMKWNLTVDDEPTFESGKRYAFVVGIARPGPRRGFTLANRNNASSPAPPRLADAADTYGGGWSVRREGNGRRRSRIDSQTEPDDRVVRARLKAESYFPAGDARFAIPPTCDGYPDVDTYRDLEFYLLARSADDDGGGRGSERGAAGPAERDGVPASPRDGATQR